MLPALRPRRSALYIPGSNARAIEKAPTIAADVLIFDLEDSVPLEKKDKAREAVAKAVAGVAGGMREVVVRINDLDSPWIARDIAAVAAARPDAVLIPKITRTDDIRRARAALAAAGAPKSMNIWLMIETPAAVLNAAAIAAIAAIPEPSVTCFVFGNNDLAADLRLQPKPGRAVLLPYISHVFLAARAHGLAVLDGTFNDLEDRKGFRNECLQAREFGLDGKTCIHPGQVPIANEAFGPDKEEVNWARKIVEAFAAPDATGLEVMRLAGRMVERLHERQARRTLQIADAIAEMEEAMKEGAPSAKAPPKPSRPLVMPKARTIGEGKS